MNIYELKLFNDFISIEHIIFNDTSIVYTYRKTMDKNDKLSDYIGKKGIAYYNDIIHETVTTLRIVK